MTTLPVSHGHITIHVTCTINITTTTQYWCQWWPYLYRMHTQYTLPLQLTPWQQHSTGVNDDLTCIACTQYTLPVQLTPWQQHSTGVSDDLTCTMDTTCMHSRPSVQLSEWMDIHSRGCHHCKRHITHSNVITSAQGSSLLWQRCAE